MCCRAEPRPPERLLPHRGPPAALELQAQGAVGLAGAFGVAVRQLAGAAAAATGAGLSRHARRPAGVVRRATTWACRSARAGECSEPGGAAARARHGRRTSRRSTSKATRSWPATSNWLMQNLRWDVAADLERLFGPAWRTQLPSRAALGAGMRLALEGRG
jgi:hypothetical protein